MHPRRRLLLRWQAWNTLADHSDPHTARGEARVRIALRLARAYLRPAWDDLQARGAVLDVSRW